MIEPLPASSKCIFGIMKYSMTIISVLLSSLAVVIIIRYLSFTSAYYRALLVAITVISALTDFYLQILLDPVFMIPLPCLYIEGILHEWFSIRPAKCYEVWIFVVSSIMVPYQLCGLYRNQILLPENHRFRLSPSYNRVLIVIVALIFVPHGLILEFGVERSPEVVAAHVQHLSSNWPSQISSRIECLVPSSMFAAAGVYTITITACIAFLSAVCAHTLYTIRSLKAISERSRWQHRRLTKSLIAQMLIPGVTLALPLLGFILQHVTQFESPVFEPLMLKIMATHSIVNSITVIFSTDLCRRTVKPVSTSAKVVLDLIKYSTALLSLMLSSLTVVVLTRGHSYATSDYRRLLIAVTVTSALNDLYLQIFLDPVFMIPLPCMYTEGLLYRLFRFQPAKCYEVWVSGLSSIAIPYLLCVLYRNQILLPPYHPLRISARSKLALVVLISSVYISLGPILEFGIERSEAVIDSYFEQLSDKWPANFRNRTKCLVPLWVVVTSSIYAAVLGGSYALFVMVCAHTLYTLSQLKIISDKTRSYHKRLTKSLIVQMIVPGVTLLVPIAGFLVQHITRFHSPEFAPFMLKIIGTHTIVHSLTVIYSTNFWQSRGKNAQSQMTNNSLRSAGFATELTAIR